MKRILFLVFGGVFFVAVACGNVWAQATGQISGTVKDQTGAVLPGVEVTVTQTETGVMRSAVTNETGSYVLSNLPIGPYRLEAGLPGFRTFIQTGFRSTQVPRSIPSWRSARSPSRSRLRLMQRW
jgi:Carboxypeptidase regulatory-like domain